LLGGPDAEPWPPGAYVWVKLGYIKNRPHVVAGSVVRMRGECVEVMDTDGYTHTVSVTNVFKTKEEAEQ
jgi:hypothetical protein